MDLMKEIGDLAMNFEACHKTLAAMGDETRQHIILEMIRLEDDEYRIEKVRFQKNMVILKLAGISDRNAAEALRNRFVYMEEEDLEELGEVVEAAEAESESAE